MRTLIEAALELLRGDDARSDIAELELVAAVVAHIERACEFCGLADREHVVHMAALDLDLQGATLGLGVVARVTVSVPGELPGADPAVVGQVAIDQAGARGGDRLRRWCTGARRVPLTMARRTTVDGGRAPGGEQSRHRGARSASCRQGCRRCRRRLRCQAHPLCCCWR